MSASLPLRDYRRLRLRYLDRCLDELEEAHERNETTVSTELAGRLASSVCGLRPGMLIADAIELVFCEQTPCMPEGAQRDDEGCRLHGDRSGLPSEVADVDELAPDGGGGPLDEAGARALTDRIKTAANQVCILLLRAHAQRAWSALGYRSWEQYVRTEFRLSRSRSYELLDQGHVLQELKVGAGLPAFPDISAHAASQIKPHLQEIISVVRVRTANVEASAAAMEAVADVIRLHRSRHVSQPRADPGSVGAGPEDLDGSDAAAQEIGPLYEAVRRLASMPDVDEVLARLPGDAGQRLGGLETARRWLNEFTGAWKQRPRRQRLRRRGGATGDRERQARENRVA